ncbi:unnamed protein product [Cladocopium goreaui]|uniref:Chaperone protein DnaJ n=1 Tax=Cladocopium goreaui TaxID=2562237 RepID=A0A9P1BML7_9DINO|nr:unnamed protein product [Cladocopium goreaui]
MTTDEVKNEIDAKVKELFETSDPETYGEFTFFLVMHEEHYSGLAKVKDVPAALRAYVKKALRVTDMPMEEGEVLTPDEAEMMLNECRDRWGTEIQRLEDAGIVSSAMLQGMKSAQTSLVPAATAAGSAAIRLSAAAINVAARHTFVAVVYRVGSVATAASGDIFGSIFLSIVADGAEIASLASRQLAQRMQNVSTVCTWASRAGTVLTVGMLGYELYSNIRMYWKGEIDGYKCAENLASSFGAAAAGFAGGAGAVALCAGAGPWGLIFAGLAGGVLASGLTTMGVKSLFQSLFGTDRDRALEKAYATLELKQGASPHEVRHAYLTLAKKAHPDKGGNREDFIKINSAYELIRASVLS